MEVWVVNAQETPPSPREVKGRRMWRSNTLCEELADRGHSVTRWRASFSHQAKQQFVKASTLVETDNYRLQYIQCSSYARHVGFRRVLSHRSLAREFDRIANSKSLRPDVIHVCNVPLELSAACVEFGRRQRIPVIVDVRDLWPESYLNLVPAKFSFLRPIFRTLLSAEVLGGRRSYRSATSITAITEPILDWALAKAGRKRQPLDKVFPMAYPAMNAKYSPDEIAGIRSRLGIPKGKFTAVYSGNVGYQTDFDTIIEAAELMQHMSDPVQIVLAGSGPRVNELRKKAKELNNVTIPGWLEGAELQMLLKSADFGIIAFHEVDDYVMSIPNKFTEYMSAGLAVVCGTKGEMWRLIETHDCGVRVPARDALSLAQALVRLASDPHRSEIMSNNAQALHRHLFSIDVIIGAMADHLEDVVHSWGERGVL